MPKNTAAGVVIAGLSTALGFALVWHMWVLAAIGLVGVIATFVRRSYDRDVDYYVPAAEVKRIEEAHFAQMQGAKA